MAGTASVAIRDAAGELRQLTHGGMIRAVRRVKELAADEARADTGDMRMSGFGRKGVKLRTRDEITGSRGYVFGKVRGLPTGVWVILDEGAPPHTIKARRRRSSKRDGGGNPALLFGSQGYFASVSHPGTKPGKATWRRIRARAERVIPAMFENDVRRIVNRG